MTEQENKTYNPQAIIDLLSLRGIAIDGDDLDYYIFVLDADDRIDNEGIADDIEYMLHAIK